MSQAAGTDLYNPLVPKAHNGERQNLQFLFADKIISIKSRLKLQFADFLTYAPLAPMHTVQFLKLSDRNKDDFSFQ